MPTPVAECIRRRWAWPAAATAREARVARWEGGSWGEPAVPPTVGRRGSRVRDCESSWRRVLLVAADFAAGGPVRVEVVIEQPPPLGLRELGREQRALVAEAVEVDTRAEVPRHALIDPDV